MAHEWLKGSLSEEVKIISGGKHGAGINQTNYPANIAEISDRGQGPKLIGFALWTLLCPYGSA